jgi:hypothetical protein
VTDLHALEALDRPGDVPADVVVGDGLFESVSQVGGAGVAGVRGEPGVGAVEPDRGRLAWLGLELGDEEGARLDALVDNGRGGA